MSTLSNYPVIITPPAKRTSGAIKLRMFDDCVVADLTPDLFISYSRQLNCVRIVKYTETLKTLVCREGYTLNEFMDCCIKYKRILNYIQ